MDDINDKKTSSYFRFYQNMMSTSHQCHLFDAFKPLASTFTSTTASTVESSNIKKSAFDMQLKLARAIIYEAREFVVNNSIDDVTETQSSSSFVSDTTFAFLQIVFFITFICLIKQYLNLRVVKEEPIRLINKSGEYDAYDLVPDTPLNRKESQKQSSTKVRNNTTIEKAKDKQNYQILQINSKINRQNNQHLINNDLFTERETILLLNKLNAAANNNNNNNAPSKKKYNTDKFVTNKRKCTSVGPVMNASCTDEKFASMLEKSVQHDENSLTCTCEANWRQAVLIHHQNEAAIYNHMCV